MSEERLDFNSEVTFEGQVIKLAKDLTKHPTPEQIGLSIYDSEALSDPFMMRYVWMHPEFCEDCKEIANSIRDEVEKRRKEFEI